MKNKLDWFDEDGNWDVRPTRILYELLLSPTYQIPMKVKKACISGVRIFQSVQGVVVQWNVIFNASAAAVVND